ncbi:hypothetical protein BAXH7_00958 [Bacillus amyloliquefaciens XH7]|nr:hypothetical protein LL3_01063 [Bacillus amyloliquefaciens LL3]AEK88100.1 hypothetical protein BAXH7_00958 [Bacillus amyloliquefaciens XH7]QBG55381.1 hypothetical protein D2M30_1050 [Bacillus amyloliquefaciens]
MLFRTLYSRSSFYAALGMFIGWKGRSISGFLNKGGVTT